MHKRPIYKEWFLVLCREEKERRMNLEALINNNYTILNGKVVKVSCIFNEDDTFMFNLIIQGDGWQCMYGNFDVFGDDFDSKEAIKALLSLLEETNIFNLEGKYVRVAVKDANSPVEYIGNIVMDNWYNYLDYYRPEEEYEQFDENRLREIL